ncbi:hypothetical protein CERSUDRAFT_101611 [Gelatoporia subvermispora B]|uniref:Uncharacterized protein n=1 Tax=Ceriporiopsis subvermispora (strain B) TaxID=914234 RepID=M2P502_CERS8|nr:hypothetical protein CERSUDRAFT_101611 [Gelatoporia subvermispora B]
MRMGRLKDAEKAVKFRALDQNDSEDDMDAGPGESWLDNITERLTTGAATELTMEHEGDGPTEATTPGARIGRGDQRG